MNAQRLVTIASTVRGEYSSGNVVHLLNSLLSQVESAVNGPSEATQRAVETTLTQLVTALVSGPTNDFSPGLRDDLSELSVAGIPVPELVGKGLAQRLQDVLGAGYLSVKPLDELRALSKVVIALATGLDSLLAGLDAVGIHAEELEPGESIVGMTMPRDEIKDVRAFKKEVAFFEHLVVALNRCIEGNAAAPTVYCLRSSNFGIDFKATLDVAAAVGLILRGVKLALDKLSKHRELKKSAEDIGIDPKLVEQLGQQSKKAMEDSVAEIEADVFQHCKLAENGDLQELKTAVRLRINGVVNRIERGFIFEVRTELPKTPTAEQKKMGETISSLSTMRFEPIAGPRLLELPEADEAEDDVLEAIPSKPKKLKKKSTSA
jgi:hypothetical protein